MPGPLVIYSAAKTTAKVIKKVHQKAKSMSAVDKPAVHAAPRRARRSRGMTMRRGKVFIGFSGKEVKNALRRAYGGRKAKR